MKFKIEVEAHGYEDTARIVDRPSCNHITTDVLEARAEWCKKNDIDVDSNVEMPRTRISLMEPICI